MLEKMFGPRSVKFRFINSFFVPAATEIHDLTLLAMKFPSQPSFIIC